jgi:hypothetical protein
VDRAQLLYIYMCLFRDFFENKVLSSDFNSTLMLPFSQASLMWTLVQAVAGPM